MQENLNKNINDELENVQIESGASHLNLRIV